MRNFFRLPLIVGKAAPIVAAGCFAVIFVSMLLGVNPDSKPLVREILGALACFLPIGVATAWVFRKLRTVYSRREARAMSIAFCLFTPISLGASLVLSEITGGIAEAIAGERYFGLIGAFVGTVIVTALLSLLVCSLVLRSTRLWQYVEQNE